MLNYCSSNYIVVFDFLDGSSNIDTAVSTGSIFTWKLTLNIGSKEEMGKLDDVFERFISFSFVDSKIPF
ncbi:hypothetical protein HID58_014671 [Brassica napus]|uniref:Uncharacterized protein n=1 Tax=Brassica napus TaxID=3708 RepID=A0ABQ8DHV6_BRANA|nr:hypothetical protein HID58_014671 [Brassica napus]